jgi:hypothetical protein
LHQNLRRFTSFKIRNKRLKFYSIKKLKKYKSPKPTQFILKNLKIKKFSTSTSKIPSLRWKIKKTNLPTKTLNLKKKKTK